MSVETDPISIKWSKCLDLLKVGDFASTIVEANELLKLIPDNPSVLSVIAIAYEYSGCDNEAIDAYKKSLENLPDQSDNYEALARIYSKQEKHFEAIEANQKALQYNPKSDIALNNLGSAYGKLGDINNAVKYIRQALDLNPNNLTIFENLLFYYNCSTKYSQADAHGLAQKYYETIYAKYGRPAPDFKLKDYKHKKMRIAFLSADFKHHPVGYFLHSIFAELDKNAYEIFCYYNDTQEDQMTHSFRTLVKNFRFIKNKSDDEVFEQIIEDRPNILIETIGFTNNKRMSVLVRKPAPVIASYLGYFATTGIKQIDYFLLDKNVVKPEEEKFYTEKVYPVSDCYMHANPYGDFSAIKPAPYKQNGYVTIGSFSTLRKINDETIATWSKILQVAPNAKLLLRTNLKDEQTSNYIQDKFVKHSIKPEQLIIKNFVKREDLCNAYAELDIALDPFPYGGGVTSIEALMMGVPLITWYGPIIMSRVSASILQTAACPELVASTLDDYVSKTVDLINDTKRIDQYRSELRERMLNSNLNIKSFTRNFEKSLETIWRDYVRTQIK